MSRSEGWEDLFAALRVAEAWTEDQSAALVDVAEQAYKAMLVWYACGDVDADFLCIEKHLARLGVTAE